MQHSAPTIDELNDYAERKKCTLVEAACTLSSPLIAKDSLWPPVDDSDDGDTGCMYSDVDLCQSERGDLLTDIAKSIGSSYKFPRSTAFLHGLGCVASAMTKSFKFMYHGKGKPVNLYIVTSQPPSTGKSGVNEAFSDPISMHYDAMNKVNRKNRMALTAQIKAVSKEVDEISVMAGGIMNAVDSAKIDELDRLNLELEASPIWQWTTTNATIESAEGVAGENDGMFNVISAEADSINILLGLSYGDKINVKANMELVLKAWDNEYFSASRVGRDTYSGKPRSTICVIAQDSSIDSLLAVGQAGRGVSERFLILREKSLLGSRNHLEHIKMDAQLSRRYESMIKNVLDETEVNLEFSEESYSYVSAYRQKIEPELADGGLYDNSMITGALGKADKQIFKIASVLHTIDHWQTLAERKYIIESDYILRAINIFDDLSQTYIKAADNMGFAGKNSEVDAVKEYLTTQAEKGKLKLTMSQLRANTKAKKALSGVRNLTMRMRDVIIPELMSQGYCYLHGNTLHINPRLRS
jgi:hypothetical protein